MAKQPKRTRKWTDADFEAALAKVRQGREELSAVLLYRIAHATDEERAKLRKELTQWLDHEMASMPPHVRKLLDDMGPSHTDA